MSAGGRRWWLWLGVAAIVAGALFASTRRGPAPASPSNDAGEQAAPAWPAQTIRRFDVTWRTLASGALAVEGQGQVASEVDLRAVLAVESFGERDGATVLSARLERVERATVRALGKDLLTPDAAPADLSRCEVLVDLDSAGEVSRLRFGAEGSPIARHVLRALVLELLAQISAAVDPRRDEVDTALGRARFQRVQDPADPSRVRTRRLEYRQLEAFPEGLGEDAEQALASEAETKLGADRSPVTIRSEEDLVVSQQEGPLSSFRAKTTVTFSMIGASTVPRRDPPRVASSDDSPRALADAARRTSLEQRSAGVSLESIVRDVKIHAALPRGGDTSWVWRDAAYLELHPEHTKELVDRAGKELDLFGRSAVFDLLVIAGTAEGQRALRGALGAWAADDTETYVVLVQRVGHLSAPEPETLDFVLAQYQALRKKSPDRARACVYALGALAGAASDRDPVRARALADRLAADLRVAGLEADRVALLRGLGNAGLSDDAPLVASHARDSSVAVRAAVASALRKMDGDVVNDTLLALATDDDGAVSRTAIGSLFRQELRDGDWAALLRATESEHIPVDARATLVNELSSRRDEAAGVLAVLTALLASPRTPADLKQRIEASLRP